MDGWREGGMNGMAWAGLDGWIGHGWVHGYQWMDEWMDGMGRMDA